MSPCEQWDGAVDRDGYGRTASNELAHRAAYLAATGPIPAGLEIDHLCRNRKCVNPDHLEAVTHGENMRRAFAHITHCKRGHEFSDENTYARPRSRNGGARQCRECNRIAARDYKLRKKASA